MTTLRAVQADITTLDVDVIVNAANGGLAGGGGVDGAIHRAGGPQILQECLEYVSATGRLPTGQAMITSGGNLPSRHVIHTVGPVFWATTAEAAQELLASCYRNSLELATTVACRTIAFPSISTGAFGYPIESASRVAVETVSKWTRKQANPIEEVIFVCFDSADLSIYLDALDAV